MTNATENTVTVDNDLTIFTAEEMKPKFMSWLDSGAVEEINMSEVSEMDTAGFQLMLMLQREAGTRGRKIRFTNFSEPVKEVLDMYRMTSRFSG